MLLSFTQAHLEKDTLYLRLIVTSFSPFLWTVFLENNSSHLLGAF